MNTDKCKRSLVFLLWVICVVLPESVPSAGLDISQSPLAVADTAEPRVMLAMSRDHQLYIKAYSDYSDLNGDGILDTTYNNSIDYYGYFDSNKCYTYTDSGPDDPFFGPVGLATAHQCSSQWSGNFLNWATMTRMDIIRKVLYGGYRNVDAKYSASAGGATVLERVLIPDDSHAFVKVFSTAATADMQKYTPYAQTTLSICNVTDTSKVNKLSPPLSLSMNINTSFSGTNYARPLIRVAGGSWPRWAAASATNQCQWGNPGQPGTNVNLLTDANKTGLNIRVKVCAANLEETNCTSYSSFDRTPVITKKPTGLLQKYWESGKPIVFGLMTGSWGNNTSGGVLRAALPDHTQEVNQEDGTFQFRDTDYIDYTYLDTGINVSTGGIVTTLDRLRISQYNFNSGSYSDCTGKDSDKCTDWGNPLSEIYQETLRYLTLTDTDGNGNPRASGSAKANKDFDSDDSSYAPSDVPPKTPSSNHSLSKKTWINTISISNWCARCSIIVISTDVNSFDTDQLASDDLGINAATQTDAVGTLEASEGDGGNYSSGKNYLIGDNGANHDKQCTGKSLSSLSAAQGVCPEAPSQEGGYHIAGLAYYARTHDMRPTIATVEGDNTFFSGDQTVNTYSVALAEKLPRFDIPVGSGSISLLPACAANSDKNATSASSDWQPCGIADLMVENLGYSNSSGKLVSGSLMVVWADATWGVKNATNKVDIKRLVLNGIERLTFCVGSACSPAITSDKVKITASAIQAQSNAAMQVGYILSGSDDDGLKLPVLRPGNKNFNVGDTPPNGVTPATANNYGKGESSAKLLESPLWYAAKYGGFETIDSTKALGAQTPQNQSWDEDGNGIPDAFFKATNPALLENALDGILNNVSSKVKSSASVAANSTRLDTTAALYQAKFNPGQWNGHLVAYKVNSADGSFATLPSWDAGEKMTAQGSGRSIFSHNGSAGISFVYGSLSGAQKALLTEDQLNYIRGDQSKEKPAGKLRTRQGLNRLMGDIVNSDPFFINSISQGYDNLPGSEGQDYLKYITSPAFIGRAPMLTVGANDGMLHVFDASFDKTNSGKEILSYVPNTVIANLPALTLPTYVVGGYHKYFVDGSPVSGDAYFDADGDSDKEWRTALAGTLGAGGKGLFALDVTFLDPVNYKTAEPAFLAKRVLWEINDKAAPDNLADDFSSSPKRYGFTNYLGFTLGQASIARMANGNFAAVFGNGYNSVSQTAVLYIVDIKTGHLIRSITTGVGNSGAMNGLASPLAVDANGDHIVDAIYAGDYQGNMWKFDVSDSNSDNWKVAFTSSGQPAPLFTTLSSQYAVSDPYYGSQVTAAVSQPITVKPVFGRHPNGGVMLYFGTGKYFLRSDNNVDIFSDPVETFYAIWDECVNYAGVTPNCSNVPISGKEKLVKQTIDYEKTGVRVTSSNEVDYSTKKGWYMDLYYGKVAKPIFTGERVISQAILRGRRVIFPTTTPELAGCNFGGNSWLMLVDALTGKRLTTSAFGVLSGGEFVADEITYTDTSTGVTTSHSSVSGIKSTVGMIDTPAILETDGATEKLVGSGSSGDTEQYSISRPAGSRQSWVQIR